MTDNIAANILLGALSGLFVAGAGYFKARKDMQQSQSTFNPAKFSKTVLLGMVVGAVVGATGLPETEVSLIASNIGVTAVLENVLKGIFRK